MTIELPPQRKIRREKRTGRYLIVPPGGRKPVGYTRATTIAGTLDNEGALGPWKAALTATGLTMRRGLQARWEELIARYGDPWYHSPESKEQTKALVEECLAVGGADDRKHVGSMLHTMTAIVDGQQRMPQHMSEDTERDVRAYRDGIDKAGIEVMEDMIEVVVVLDDHRVAGTFDRLVRVPGFKLPLIADLKTGASLDYQQHAIAVQEAIYSRANNIYIQGPKPDGSQDERHPMPEVDQDNGIVLWLDAGTGKLEVRVVDLGPGWEAFEHSMWTRTWRTRKLLHTLDEARPADLTDLLERSVEAVQARNNLRSRQRQAHEAVPELGPLSPEDDEDATIIPVRRHAANLSNQKFEQTRLREQLQKRIDALGRNPEARKQLPKEWPKGMPILKDRNAAHTPNDLQQIDRLLTDMESRFEKRKETN